VKLLSEEVVVKMKKKKVSEKEKVKPLKFLQNLTLGRILGLGY